MVVLAILVGAGFGLRAYLSAPPPAPRYETVAVDRGDIDETVQATGTLEAKRVVSVGGEISGRIATVEVEVNDRVTQGQVLATLDPASLDNALTEAKGSLSTAKIEVSRASASLDAAKITKERDEALFDQGLVSKEELQAAQSSYDLAKADLSRARSERTLAKVRVEQAQTNRGKATIVSPIDGVVLTRSVEPGNAIAASLQAPELFTLAEDLSVMRLDLGVDEADVGRVQAGQSATFTVDAWPGRSFDAKVERVDLAPTATESSTVVTYTAVLSVDNAGQRLRPGMTATATILVERHAAVLRVPMLALRFDPAKTQTATESSGRSNNPLAPPMPPRRTRKTTGAQAATRPTGEDAQELYLLRDGEPTPVRVRTGASDGRFTEIEPDELEEGDEVIVGMELGQ